MLWVGLSGGIGSGKSTAAARLAHLGARVIDADQVAREVVQPGSPGLAAVVARFGRDVLGPDGALDRAALGQLVFSDGAARADLEAITHPLIFTRSTQLLADAPADAVVVHDIPLLVELDRVGDYALTVIIDVAEEERLVRLTRDRGMDADEATRRMSAQASDQQRRAAADVLVANDGDVPELHDVLDRLWVQRLLPFEANLRQHRPSPITAADPWSATLTGPDPQARAISRLRAALGDAVGWVASAPGTESEIRLQTHLARPSVLADPQTSSRLAKVGLLAVPADAGEEVDEKVGGLAGADPAVPVRIDLHLG